MALLAAIVAAAQIDPIKKIFAWWCFFACGCENRLYICGVETVRQLKLKAMMTPEQYLNEYSKKEKFTDTQEFQDLLSDFVRSEWQHSKDTPYQIMKSQMEGKEYWQHMAFFKNGEINMRFTAYWKGYMNARCVYMRLADAE